MTISELDEKVLTICVECNATNRIKIEKARSLAPLCGKCGKTLSFHSFVSSLGEEQLTKLIDRTKDIPLVVDFWAPWCGPCLSFAPTFERLAARHAGSFNFAKIDTESNPSAGEIYRIQAVPTFILFKNGAERDRKSGAMPESVFENWLIEASRF